MVEPLVNSGQRGKNPETAAEAEIVSIRRRRMPVAERERSIVDGAIRFFAEHGFNAQLRDLASDIGVTHTLVYHYFPTKQALVDRVYQEVFEGRWNPAWEALLDDPALAVEDKLTRFYSDYVNHALSREFVRVLVFSGLTDHTITDRFFAMLRERLFPRLIRETRRDRGETSRRKPSQREQELLMGLHGGFFYITMRRWIYGQGVGAEAAPGPYADDLVRDRVRAYLSASRELFGGPPAPVSSPRPRKGRSSSSPLQETP